MDPGREYGTGKRIDRYGFSLQGPGLHYTWEQWKYTAPSETGGSLANLDLGEGTYTLSVDGGSGAHVTLEFIVTRLTTPSGERWHSVVQWAPDRPNDGYIWVPAGKVATGFTINVSAGELRFSIIDPAGKTKFRYSRSSRSEKPGESPCSLGELHLEHNEKGWYFLQADEESFVNLLYQWTPSDATSLKEVVTTPIVSEKEAPTPPSALFLTASAVPKDKSLYITGEKVIMVGKVTDEKNPVSGAKIDLKIHFPDGSVKTGPGASTNTYGNYKAFYEIPKIPFKTEPPKPEDLKPQEWIIEVIATYTGNPSTKETPKALKASQKIPIQVLPISLKLHGIYPVQTVTRDDYQYLPKIKGENYMATGRIAAVRAMVSCPSLKGAPKGTSLPEVELALYVTDLDTLNRAQKPIYKKAPISHKPTPVDFFFTLKRGRYLLNIQLDTEERYGLNPKERRGKSVQVTAKKMKELRIKFIPLFIPMTGNTARSQYSRFCKGQSKFIKSIYPLPDSKLKFDPRPRTMNLKAIPDPRTDLMKTRYFLLNDLSVIAFLRGRFFLPGYSRTVGLLPNDQSWWPTNEGADGFSVPRLYPAAVLVKYDAYPNIHDVGTVGEGVTAHEIGHTLGLNTGLFNEEYRAPRYGKKVWGLILKKKPKKPYEWGVYDLMPLLERDDAFRKHWRHVAIDRVYCFMGNNIVGEGQETWVCEKTYPELFKSLMDPPGGKVVYVAGAIHKNGKVELDNWYLTEGEPDPLYEGGAYMIQCVSPAGEALYSMGFGWDVEDFFARAGFLPFGFVIPYPEGTSKILIKKGDHVLKEVQRTSNSPAVTIQHPNGGEILDRKLDVKWNAEDRDGDELFYSVLYSHDGGETWDVLTVELDETSYMVDLSELPGGDRCLVRVVATDGFNTGYDESDGFFSVGDKAPSAYIASPKEGDVYQAGDEMLFEGIGYDLEAGVLESTGLIVQWSSSLDGTLGVGEELLIDGLSQGDHEITLTVRDSTGKTAEDEVNIRIEGEKAQKPETKQLPYSKLIQVDASSNCYRIPSWEGIAERAITELLTPGKHRIRLVSGDFSFWSSREIYEPFICLLFIAAGEYEQEAFKIDDTNVSTQATLATLRGVGDELTIDVYKPTNMRAFFIDVDPDPDPNRGSATIMIQKYVGEEPVHRGVLDLSGAGEDWAREWEVLSTAKDFGGGGKAGFYPEAVRSGHAHPHPGRRGILYLHPTSQEEPARIARRVKLKGNRPTLRMGVTGNRDIDGDWALIVKVNDEPLEKEKIIAGAEGWQDLSFDLSAFSGQNVDIEIEARANNWYYEFVFFDYIQVAERAAEESERVLPTEGELAHAEVEFTLLSTNKPYSSVDAAMISASGNRVMYVSGPGGNDAVMVVNSDGTGSTEVFHDGKMTDPFDTRYKLLRKGLPYISGDGNTIAFAVANGVGSAVSYLCLINWDGQWKKPQIIRFDNLADPDYWVWVVYEPSISDDGSKIVVEVGFKQWDEYYSCIVSTDKHGGTPRSLLRFGHHETVKYYTWGKPVLISGNGQRIIFQGKEADDWESGYVLWSMNPDGSDLKNITPAGAVALEYGVPSYNISSDGKTAGLLVNFPEVDGWQYVLVNARDGSNVRKIHTYEGDSLVYVNYHTQQITPDAGRVFYCYARAAASDFYRKNSDDTGDMVALDANTENLPWEYQDVRPGRGNIGGDQRFYMDRTGSRFLVIKEKEPGDYDLYLVRIKGEEAESVVRKVEISEPRPAREKPDGERVENLTSNSDFSQGLENWIIEEHGYYDPDILHPYSLGTYPPDASKGYLEMGVYGGYHYASQVVPVSSIDLQFRCQIKVKSWSTYQEKEVGLVATSISFLDEKDDFLGALHYYLGPDYSHESTLKDRWIKLSEETETPTDWYEVEVSLQQVLQEELGIDGESIRKMVITAVVFGTHEDKTYTVGCFDNFYLGEKEASL